MNRTRIAAGLAGVLLVAGSSSAFAGEIKIGPFGRVESSGGAEIQVDGASDSPLTAAHPWAGGYVALTGNGNNGEPGICASGENDYWYYQWDNQTSRDCNEQLFDEENMGYLTNP